ncbi:MAG: hypothetical protein C0592_14165 [Marinilabiliales bacterium]|nr:MAG: hypothetical protein C0592_14165 [Marinilabiliales bacterium]
MHAYRFRINSDDNEEFLRVIDVLANQTFEEFHNTLVSTCKFKEMELASFYLCDNEWHKKREITLMDMNVDGEEEDEEQQARKKVLIMKDIKMRQIINDPHQKILYVFDFMKMITLNIELMKILEADMEEKYPLILEQNSELHLHARSDMDIFSEELLTEDDDALNNLSEENMDNDAADDMN